MKIILVLGIFLVGISIPYIISAIIICLIQTKSIKNKAVKILIIIIVLFCTCILFYKIAITD